MLLSCKYKIPGFILIFAGTVLLVFYFGFDFRFEMPVFAVISSFMETKFFTSFKTNFADELIMILFLTGLALLTFSKEKNEIDSYKTVRVNAVKNTILSNTLFLIFSVLFIYGSGFIAIAIINLFLPFVLYLVFFNILKRRASGPATADH